MSATELVTLYSMPASLIAITVVTPLVVLVVRHTIQRTIDASFRKIELDLASRAAFADRIYNQRFSLVIEISKKLERVRSDIERLVNGRVSKDEIAPKGEMIGLTEIYEDLRVIRVVLGADLGSLLEGKAKLASIVASQWEQLQHDPEQFAKLLREWSEINDRLFLAIARIFEFSHEEFRGSPK